MQPGLALCTAHGREERARLQCVNVTAARNLRKTTTADQAAQPKKLGLVTPLSATVRYSGCSAPRASHYLPRVQRSPLSLRHTLPSNNDAVLGSGSRPSPHRRCYPLPDTNRGFRH